MYTKDKVFYIDEITGYDRVLVFDKALGKKICKELLVTDNTGFTISISSELIDELHKLKENINLGLM